MVKHTVIAALVGLGFCASVASAQTPATTTTTTTDPHMTINQRLENQHDRIHRHEGRPVDQSRTHEAARQ